MGRLFTRFSVGVAMCALTLAPAVCAQSLQMTRADSTVATRAAAQIATLLHVSINVKEHETPARFDGVPLSAALKLAGVEIGKGPQLTLALLVEAADGYKVLFALAELDPAFATREILLADKRDGKPLDDKQGPFRIVAPGDKRPARWIREGTTLKIVPVK